MSQVKTNEKKWDTWMDGFVIFQKENITFYQYTEFRNVNLINANIFKATFKTKTVTLKNVYLNLNDNTLDNLINEIKRYRKLEIHDNILKFYGITKQENTDNYMIILEYVNEGSLRQYLKTNFQKLDWFAKLNLAKQIGNVLMFLHSNDIIHGKFNSENILIHNGNIKLNIFGLTQIMPLRFFTNNHDPIQYMDPQYLELFSPIGKNKNSDIFGLGIILWEISSGSPPFEMESSSNVDLLYNISKGKREMAISGTPHKYKEIYTDCWKHNGNTRPDIFQVVKNLSEIIISDISVEFETPYVEDIKLENLNMQNEEPEIKSDLLFTDATIEVNSFIKDLIEFFIDISTKQSQDMKPILVKNYIREHEKNPVEILFEMIRHPSEHLFTSLIGFFYRYGIGTVVDNQMAIKFFNLAANEIVDTSSSNSLPFMKLYNINKEIGAIFLADMYFHGLGVEQDTKKAFQIYSNVADKGSNIALNSMAYCYDKGFGVEKNEEKAFETYLKSAEKGNLMAQSNVGSCYKDGSGITIDITKGFQYRIKSARAGNINAMHNVGFYYDLGIGVSEDKKEAFKWYIKAAEKGYSISQYNLGVYYGSDHGISNDQVKAFEWYKKAAENDDYKSQYIIGGYFYAGIGTRKDIIKAIYWLDKAKENGNISANGLLEEIMYLLQ
ncbi:hypothetical protein Glove_350g58 [Diversispora epigaea]|uniref:Protein kinase domain-containing protein n=1 Tax=Diversispora epigaea TaxID=1348612 RepID=A0A397HCR6_9GLOM|nr:hypothetical protein Glove_350g58 [Diversispora epigaea]